MLTKVFNSGNSQAVRIPKEMRLKTDNVHIKQWGSSLIISQKPHNWDLFFASLSDFSDDYLSEGRKQPKLEVREEIK